MNKKLVIILTTIIAVTTVLWYRLHHAGPVPIPLEYVFGNPQKTAPRLSPDGTQIAYIAPHEGVLNIWIRQLDTHKEYSITSDKGRGIQAFMWGYDNKTLLYIQDKDGDENYNLYVVDKDTKEVRALTPFSGTKVQILEYSWKQPDEALILANKDNPEHFDVYHLQLSTGALRLVEKNPGNVRAWYSNKRLEVLACEVSDDEGGSRLMLKDPATKSFSKQLVRWDHNESISSKVFAITLRNTIVLADPHNYDTARLTETNLTTGDVKIWYENERYDVAGVMMHPQTEELIAVNVFEAKQQIHVLNEKYQVDFAILKNHLGEGNLGVSSQSVDGNKWIVVSEADVRPSTYYVYDRTTKELIKLFTSRPEFENLPLAHTEPIAYTTSDGMHIEGYVTQASDLASPASGTPKPMILLVHGGPNSRDGWGFSPMLQWYASLGYSVLQLNYRSSTGYGKKHLTAGDHQWGRKMQDDLTEGVQWAIDQGIADPRRIAIVGGSYGGYAVLAAAAFTPDLFAAGVDLVGPSNLITMLKSMPSYWKSFKVWFAKRVGDPDKDAQELKKSSPLFYADRIKMPLLIGQGANDPRVPQAESDQIVAALKEHNVPHEYIVYPNEGHGFVRPENRLDFYQRVAVFLDKYVKNKK